MNEDKIEIKKGRTVKLIIRSDSFLILNLFNYIKCNNSVKELFKEYDIKAVNIWDNISTCGLLEIDENIKSLHFLGRQKDTEIEQVYRFSNILAIEWDNTEHISIDFSRFKHIEEINIAWSPNFIFKDALSLLYIRLYRYSKEIFDLDLPNKIEFIELIQGKLKSMQGIEKYQSLKALVLYSQPKIEDYTAIGELNNLEFLHIHGGQLKDITPFTKLKKLKWLVLENCKHIETLKPLLELENLIGVQLVGTTKPLDGDKSIRDIKNKYEYSYPYKTVSQRLYKEL